MQPESPCSCCLLIDELDDFLNSILNLTLQDGADVEKGTKGTDATAGLNERYHYILRTRAARVSSATTLCLLIMALLVMTVGLFGGLYIYRQMTRTRVRPLSLQFILLKVLSLNWSSYSESLSNS